MKSLLAKPWGPALLLTIALMGIAVPLLVVAYNLQGWPGCLSAALAGGTCLASGLVSLLLVHQFQAPDQVLHQVLFGMFPRMGIPLIVCMVTYLHGGMLVENGFVYYIMAFYFVTLLVETVMLTGMLTEQAPKHQPTESKTG